MALLDLVQTGRLEFQAPDLVRFRGLAQGRAAAEAKGVAPNVFNAANEVAVAAFLAGQLGFAQIPVIIAEVLERAEFADPVTLNDVLEIDAESRALTADLLVKLQRKSA